MLSLLHTCGERAAEGNSWALRAAVARLLYVNASACTAAVHRQVLDSLVDFAVEGVELPAEGEGEGEGEEAVVIEPLRASSWPGMLCGVLTARRPPLSTTARLGLAAPRARVQWLVARSLTVARPRRRPATGGRPPSACPTPRRPQA